MSLPEIEQHRVKKLLGKFCEERVSPQVQDRVKLSFNIRGNKVTLVESRILVREPSRLIESRIAQFEYNPGINCWTLYCYNRNSKRCPYVPKHDQGSLDKLIQEVDKDPTGIFWG